MKNRKFLCAVLSTALFLCGGCGQKTKDVSLETTDSSYQNQPLSAKEDVIVVMGPSSEPSAGFDPVYGWGAGEHIHEPLIQSTLTVTDEDLQIGYDLAEEIDVSEDGLTWTVKIRDDVYFTDGEKLTAEDVAFTYNLLRDGSSVQDFTMLKSAEAADEKTIIFSMNRPYSIWPYTMSCAGIIPEHAYGPDYGEHPIGSGRYVLKQWDRGQQVIFEANPDYYGDPPKMKKLTILFMEEDAAYLAVQSGQVDLAYTSASYVESPAEHYSEQERAENDISTEDLKDIPAQIPGYRLLALESVDNRGFNLPAVPSGEISTSGVPLGNDFTCDVLVRRAINLGIDRERMIAEVLNGYGSPAYSVCDKMPWYQASAQISYDPEKAKNLLDEAGWHEGESGIREKEGKKAGFSLFYPAGDSIRQALAFNTANQLETLGIAVETQGVGWDTAYDQAQANPLMWGWGTHTPMELYHIYHTADNAHATDNPHVTDNPLAVDNAQTMENKSYAQYSPYANPQVDAYMDQALASSDLDEANRLWKMAQWDGETGITHDGDIPWIWLVNIDHLYWVREGLETGNQKIHPHGHGWSIVNNVDKWSWKSE